MKKRLLAIVISLVLISNLIYSEEIVEKEKRIDIYSTQAMTLKSFLDKITQEFNVFFNFSVNVTKSEFIDINITKGSLKEIIFILEDNYNLLIKPLNEKTYLVNNKDSSLKELKITKTYYVNDNIEELQKKLITFYGANVKVIGINNNQIIIEMLNSLENDIKKFISIYNSKNDLYENIIYKLEYVEANEISKLLIDTYKLDEKDVLIYENDKLIISAPKNKFKEIINTIKVLDVKEETITIEMMILDREFVKEDRYGLEYSDSFRINRGSDIGLGLSINDFMPTQMELSQFFSNSRILSKPKILTKNRKKVNLHLGDERAVVSIVEETDQETGDKVKSSQVNYVKTGIEISATPYLHNENNISLDVKLNLTNVTDYTTTELGSSYPNFKTKKLTSNINLRPNEVVFLTGLISESEKTETTGIPILSSIPIINVLFRKEVKKPTQTEIILAIRVTTNYLENKNLLKFDDDSEYQKNYKKYYENLNKIIKKKK